MRKFVRIAAWILPLLLTACFHRHHKPVPNQSLAPPVLETTQAESVPPPSPAQTTVPEQTAPATQPVPQPPPPKPEEKPAHKPVHHRRQENKNVEQASNPAPEVSAIGQLSPGDPSSLRVQTETSLESIDRRLKKIDRPLSDQEQKTVAQIREFLKQARAALGAGDIDGAHTLALKAKVLLDEITH